jgi:glycerol dehydrogenase-like iron-containing ADH family enzyme
MPFCKLIVGVGGGRGIGSTYFARGLAGAVSAVPTASTASPSDSAVAIVLNVVQPERNKVKHNIRIFITMIYYRT